MTKFYSLNIGLAKVKVVSKTAIIFLTPISWPIQKVIHYKCNSKETTKLTSPFWCKCHDIYQVIHFLKDSLRFTECWTDNQQSIDQLTKPSVWRLRLQKKILLIFLCTHAYLLFNKLSTLTNGDLINIKVNKIWPTLTIKKFCILFIVKVSRNYN